MIRDDLDSMFQQEYRFTIWRLWGLIVLLVLLTLGGCVVVFRWTSTPPEDQPYSAPLRTRPPEGR